MDGERARQPAHELSQPLTVVLSNTRGCLEMIGDGCDPTELTERLESAAATAERTAEIRREKRDRDSFPGCSYRVATGTGWK